VPKHQAEWLHVANEFDKKWNYPYCCGSIDGKHICLQAPINTGSEYFNCKTFSANSYFHILLLHSHKFLNLQSYFDSANYHS
jgi:hypothetical protein